MILQRLKHTPWVCSFGTHMFGATWITRVEHSLLWPEEVGAAEQGMVLGGFESQTGLTYNFTFWHLWVEAY